MKGGRGERRKPEVTAKFDPRVGLCSAYANVRPLENGRGSTFYFCELALTDRRFRKYPQLPVVECGGFVPAPLQ